MKKIEICGLVCFGIFTGILLFSILGLQRVINDGLLDQIVLSPDNEDLWAFNPGKAKACVQRNFTFYNLTNPRGFVYRNQKPKFNQVNSFVYQEKFNFTNITYSEDKSTIDYNYWLFFDIMEKSRNVNDTISIVNLSPLSFWSVLDTADISQIAIQGFGGLFLQSNGTLLSQAIGQGVQALYLANQSSLNALCSKKKLGTDVCEMLWSDPIYGFSDPGNYEVWVDWAYFNDASSGQVLYRYFGLSRAQMQDIKAEFSTWCGSISEVLNNWYCDGQQCSTFDLTVRQLGNSSITREPPVGEAVDSICLTGNITCEGYPQLYAFYKYEFPKIHKESKYQNLTFAKETLELLFSPYNGTLLNVGNLSEFFKTGYSYDKKQDKKSLARLVEITHVVGEHLNEQAVVVWEYGKYFINEFIMKKSKKGDTKLTAMAGLGAGALYQSFTEFGEWVLRELLNLIVAELMPECSQFLVKTIEGMKEERAEEICSDINRENYRNYYRLIQPCDNEYFAEEFKARNNFTIYEMAELCDHSEESVYSLTISAHQKIQGHYNCSFNKNQPRCTEYELALYQFIGSNVTLHPIDSNIVQYPSALTGHHWNDSLAEWEYRHFLNEVHLSPDFDTKSYTNLTRLTDLMSFDKLFSVGMVQNVVLIEDEAKFTELYYLGNRSLAIEYLRFITIEVGFGGFVQTHSAHEYLFGYEDPFLKTLKQLDPLMGGDPSLQEVVALNEPNSTLEESSNHPQSMYTGYSDPYLTRNYVRNLHKEYITFNHTYWNGYEILTEQANPYKEKVYLKGTDSVQNRPLSSKDDIQYIYVENLYRVGSLAFEDTEQRFGFDLYRYRIADEFLASEDRLPQNKKFYQKFEGLTNLSFMGPPVFAGRNHFLGTEDGWENMVEFYDETGTDRQEPNHYDETVMLMEPRSGAVFEATIYLQSSLYFKGGDVLFKNKPIMLPFLTVHRSGNATKDTVDDLFSPLKFALGLPRKMVLISVVGMLMCIVGVCICRLATRRKVVKESLLESGHELDLPSEGRRNSDEIARYDRVMKKEEFEDERPLQRSPDPVVAAVPPAPQERPSQYESESSLPPVQEQPHEDESEVELRSAKQEQPVPVAQQEASAPEVHEQPAPQVHQQSAPEVHEQPEKEEGEEKKEEAGEKKEGSVYVVPKDSTMTITSDML